MSALTIVPLVRMRASSMHLRPDIFTTNTSNKNVPKAIMKVVTHAGTLTDILAGSTRRRRSSISYRAYADLRVDTLETQSHRD